MAADSNITLKKPSQHLKFRLIVCSLLLLSGLGGFVALASLKKPPAAAGNGERALKVTVMRATAAAVQVTISGYGQVRPLKEVQIASEVAGQVTAVHPRLHVGESVATGELLFQIDNRNYKAALIQARAEADQWRSVLARLEKQSVIDAERLKTLQRNRDLASAEFERFSALLDQHGVGTRSGVERAEQGFNAAMDQHDQLALSVSVNPLRIKEADSSLAAAQARLSQAQTNLQRCEVHAPFNGRIKAVKIEQGQYVSPGQGLLTVADDTLLEIHVPLDSRDVREWLHFAEPENHPPAAWFERLEPVACSIRWTEAPWDHAWEGSLHRVVDFNPKTRTITVAVRISGAAALKGGRLPLVEGMFCEVNIPGLVLPRAFRIPRHAVGFRGTVFTVVDRRLKTVAVEVARENGDDVLVVGGLNEGDTVITTRLIDPLEGALIEVITDPSNGKADSL
ncbi:MAG: biotin/lipoyl-binding protein [Desulfobacteraceae bacterium]|nr:MAG: biotin/lipoyl-binding protein [Desulfobacteraceae bacterium]